MRLYVNGQQKEDRKTESMKSIDNGKGIQVLVTAVLAAVLLWTVPGDAAGADTLTAGSIPSILESVEENGGGTGESETQTNDEGEAEQETEKLYNETVQLTEEDILRMNGGDASFVYSDEGYLTFLRGKFYEGKINGFEDAIVSLNGIARLLGLSKGSEFFAVFAEQDKQGYTYILYKQRYADLTIQNAVLKVVIDPDGYTAGLSCSFTPNVGIARTESSITAAEAEQTVLDTYPAYNLQVFSDHTRQTSVTYNGVACHAWAVFTNYPEEEEAPDGRGYLEHLISYDGFYLGYLAVSSPEELVLGDDAQTEAARYWFDGLEEASYTGTVRLHDGTERTVTVPVARDSADGTYYLADVNRHILLADCYSWMYKNEIAPWMSENNTGWPDAYLLTYESYIRVYDFYRDYGLESVDGFGTPIVILTDYCNGNGRPLDNACYMGISNGWAMFGASDLNDYGECIDVAAHEFTHGVTTYTIGGDLYENESGAVNEGFSDVMGNLCELLLGATEDTDWLLGENCGSPVRSMSCPWDYQQPVTIGGKYYQEPAETPLWENDYGGVHTNNSLISHIAWQLCRDGMDLQEAFGLWRETMNMLTPRSGYREVHEALKFVARVRGMDPQWQKQIDILCERAGY